MAGAVGGTVAGDVVDNAVSSATGDTLLPNVASGAAGGALGREGGARSGANGALGADLYNKQLHAEEKSLAKKLADASGGKYTEEQMEGQMRIMGGPIRGSRNAGTG
ncbi:hypothetical protein K788_0000590 [Paraburkholderia caribensis MBA4]|uniref:Uncharacterized protein n=1 Tax=Paraburkholderia caribensis MBA4 TaxID=1323664 RepID=A0A0P0RHS2_9BURK|nr:hypothetical protein K788_0000590 [Paraburkholderia caribensis MBA4]